MYIPPLTQSLTSDVTASSEAKNATALAISERRRGDPQAPAL